MTMTIQLEKVSIPYRYTKNSSLYRTSNRRHQVSIPYRYTKNKNRIGGRRMLEFSFNPLQVHKKPVCNLCLNKNKMLVSIPYRYTKNFLQKTMPNKAPLLFQSPIGTQKTYTPSAITTCCFMFQSPIGTQKTCLQSLSEQEQNVSFNPLQVHKKLTEGKIYLLREIQFQSPIGTQKTVIPRGKI